MPSVMLPLPCGLWGSPTRLPVSSTSGTTSTKRGGCSLRLLGTFFLVLVAVGGGMVSARFGGNAVPYGAKVVAPALMVMAVILFMGTVSGAHLNPAVSIAFAARGDFPWKRVPAYIVAQFLGAILATLLLWALIGKQGSAGLTLPGQRHLDHHGDAVGDGADRRAGQRDPGHRVGRSAGRAAGRPRRGRLHRAGRAVGIAGQRRVDEPGPIARARVLVLGDWTSWWAYLVGPVAGALIAVGIAYVLRGRGGGRSGVAAAQGTIGRDWRLGSRPRP